MVCACFRRSEPERFSTANCHSAASHTHVFHIETAVHYCIGICTATGIYPGWDESDEIPESTAVVGVSAKDEFHTLKPEELGTKNSQKMTA